MGNLWAIATFVGPIQLAAVIRGAIVRNRRSATPQELARTDAATQRLYQEEDAEDHRRDVQR